MTWTIGRLCAAATALVMALILGLAIIAAGAGVADACAAGTLTTGNSPQPKASTQATDDQWDARQRGNARIIASVGAQRHIPRRGWIIAVATAMQESTLRNLPGGDRDSIGLFQQRPSQGWGTPEQLRDPVYTSGKFYDKLQRVNGWQTMPLTQAAQAVQISAFPDAYAKWETHATALINTFGLPPTDCVTPAGAADWVIPAPGPIVSGFRPADRPGHDGIDIAAPKGTTIRAAASGVVSLITCNASLGGQPYPCDSDGSPAVAGCGWYTEIRHPGNITTRYCHQLHRPHIAIGQTVTAGQPIGVVGTSGNSSGPHLHFEIHTGNPATSQNAIDAQTFLRAARTTDDTPQSAASPTGSTQ